MIDGTQPVLKYNEWIDFYSILFCLLKTVNLCLKWYMICSGWQRKYLQMETQSDPTPHRIAPYDHPNQSHAAVHYSVLHGTILH